MATKSEKDDISTSRVAQKSSEGGMPAEEMMADEAGRFKRHDPLPFAPAKPSWIPGLVEVEFRENVKPTVIAPAAAASPKVGSPIGKDLTEFNRILQRNQLQYAESTFSLSPEEAANAQATALENKVKVANLNNFVTLHFPQEADVCRIADELNRLPEVERATPIPEASPPQTPLNEPLIGTSDQVVLNPVTGLENQWYIFRCRADKAWVMSSGNNVIIADIDWGYRTSHQDLASRLDLSHAYNSYDGSTNVSHGTDIFHGTGVMGLAGAADNNLGMAGFAFGASLWPIQANIGPGKSIGNNEWARAIDWVRTADSGGRRKVIILEVQTARPVFGNYEQIPSVNAAIKTAIGNGIVVCVAAGNGDRGAAIDDRGKPFSSTGSILVGATEYHPTENRRAHFSNYGSRIVVSAPGDSDHDLTCDNSGDDRYRNRFGGTSGATPKVAGTAALMLSVNPSLSHNTIRNILEMTGTEVVTQRLKPVGAFLNSEEAVRKSFMDPDDKKRPWLRVPFYVRPPKFKNDINKIDLYSDRGVLWESDVDLNAVSPLKNTAIQRLISLTKRTIAVNLAGIEGALKTGKVAGGRRQIKGRELNYDVVANAGVLADKIKSLLMVASGDDTNVQILGGGKHLLVQIPTARVNVASESVVGMTATAAATVEAIIQVFKVGMMAAPMVHAAVWGEYPQTVGMSGGNVASVLNIPQNNEGLGFGMRNIMANHFAAITKKNAMNAAALASIFEQIGEFEMGNAMGIFEDHQLLGMAYQGLNANNLVHETVNANGKTGTIGTVAETIVATALEHKVIRVGKKLPSGYVLYEANDASYWNAYCAAGSLAATMVNCGSLRGAQAVSSTLLYFNDIIEKETALPGCDFGRVMGTAVGFSFFSHSIYGGGGPGIFNGNHIVTRHSRGFAIPCVAAAVALDAGTQMFTPEMTSGLVGAIYGEIKEFREPIISIAEAV
jgi:methyl-coenzyme M reductase beta subunit